MRSLLVLATVLVSAAGVTAGAGDDGPSELIFYHANDLLASPDNPDDKYTATITLAARHRGWELTLSENMFTDRRVNMIRFDETYLTLARDFTPGDKGWVVRAETGVAHVGEGIFGQSFQNFVHRTFGQDERILPYVSEDTHLFFGLRASRPVPVKKRLVLTPFVEVETAGFKRHGLAALSASLEVAPKFHLLGEAGFRWTRTDFAELDVFVDDSEPAYGVGFSYKRWFDVRWTRNYFGTDERHWHLLWRIPIKKKSDGAEAKN